MMAKPTLSVLLPEIFPVISAHLPLYTYSSTLLSLALTDRRLNEIIIPHLLYQSVWLEGEKRTSDVLRKLRTQAESVDPQSLLEGGKIPLAHHIRRLCISSELSADSRERNVDVIRQLHALIDLGCLPNLASLVLHLSDGWYMDDQYARIQGFGQLDNDFWVALKQECPRLNEISLGGTTDWVGNRWVEDSCLFEYQALQSFRLEYVYYHPSASDDVSSTPALHRLFSDLTVNSPFLHTLALNLYTEELIDVTDKDGLFTQHFPHLRALTLHRFTVERPEIASEFWSRHPNLELVELDWVLGHWFQKLSVGILPKLRVLQAPFDDARMLLPLLGDQLINLTISSSINAQVPYLLRSALPNGLPSLRSLGIRQRDSKRTTEIGWEASRWQEDENGNIYEVSKRKAARHFEAPHIMSIARGAPNLEELELTGECQPPIDSIASALSMFSNLKRLYIWRTNYGLFQQFVPYGMKRTFLEDAREFALGCPSLESVTAVESRSQGYMHVCAKIQRGVDGTLTLREVTGFGRVIGLDDRDYPDFW